jgi:hypothetical protein
MLEQRIALGEVDYIYSHSAHKPIHISHLEVKPLQQARAVRVIPHPHVVAVGVTTPYLLKVGAFKASIEDHRVPTVRLLGFHLLSIIVITRIVRGVLAAASEINVRLAHFAWGFESNHFGDGFRS